MICTIISYTYSMMLFLAPLGEHDTYTKRFKKGQFLKAITTSTSATKKKTKNYCINSKFSEILFDNLKLLITCSTREDIIISIRRCTVS